MVFIATGLVKHVTHAHYTKEKYIELDAIDGIKCEQITHVKIFGISNKSLNVPTDAAAKFLSKAKTCIQYIQNVHAEDANDELLSYIGITPNRSPSESINVICLVMKNCLFRELQLGQDFPDSTDLTIHGGNYEFIEQATHVKQLNIYDTKIPMFNIIKFVRNNQELVELVIGPPLYNIDNIRVHNAIFNIRKLQLFVFDNISVNQMTKSIISENIETFDAYDGGYSMRHTHILRSKEEMPLFLSRIFNVRDQFDMVSLNVSSVPLIELVLDKLKSSVLRITVMPDKREVFDAITRIGNHYNVDMSDANILASLPNDLESLKIYYFNALVSFDPKKLSKFYKLRALNIVSESTSRAVPSSDASKNRLLNDISLEREMPEHLKRLERLETDLFQRDNVDMYDDFLQLKRLKFITIRFNADQKSAAEYVLEHFYTLGLTDWAFTINYEQKQISGVKVSHELSNIF